MRVWLTLLCHPESGEVYQWGSKAACKTKTDLLHPRHVRDLGRGEKESTRSCDRSQLM